MEWREETWWGREGSKGRWGGEGGEGIDEKIIKWKREERRRRTQVR